MSLPEEYSLSQKLATAAAVGNSLWNTMPTQKGNLMRTARFHLDSNSES